MFSTVKDTAAREKENMANEGGISDAASAYRSKKDQVSNAINASKDNLQDAKHKLQDAGHDIQDIAHRAGEQLHDIGTQVREFANTTNNNVHDIADAMTTKIRKRPLATTGIALLAGVIVGRLFARK